MLEKLVVKKQVSQEIVCWKVDCKGIAPNTILQPDEGITLLITVEGQQKIFMGKSKTLFSLLNPGKETKLFGGGKVYKNCEIYAIDQASEFNAEWGLAGPNVIPCSDVIPAPGGKTYRIDCNAVAFGKYYYKIENYYNFIISVNFDDAGRITRDAIREFLRGQTTPIIKTRISNEIISKGLKGCQANLSIVSEDIKDDINKILISKGMSLKSFVVERVDFAPDYKAKKEQQTHLMIDNSNKVLINSGIRDDIDLAADKVNKLDIPLINATKEPAAPANGIGATLAASTVTFCPRCGESNDSSCNYCRRCGEKLRK